MVLVVEDDPAIAASLERMLRYAGHEVVVVPSTMEALSLLELRPPKLIILDLHMSGVDGMTFLKSVRADPSLKKVPIVIYTADFSAEAEREARAAGADDYIVKGIIGTSALMQRLARYC